MKVQVWAPKAETMELDLPAHRRPMRRDPRGWWSAEMDDIGDYAFVVDRRGPFPDPRSPWQPEGVHGRSRAIDHSAFLWTDARFEAPPLSAAIVYELHVGTFTPEGTFDAAIGRIPHLLALGVTHVELM